MVRRAACLIAVMLAVLVACASARGQYRMYVEGMGQMFNQGGALNPSGIWNTPLAGSAPVDPESANLVAIMNQWFPGPAGNHANFSEHSGQYLYIAAATDPLVKVTLDPGAPYEQQLQQAVNQVPFPSYALPSPDTDQRMAILQPSSNCVWEFWHLHQATDGWHAGWGGRDCQVWGDPGVYRNRKDAAGNVLGQNGWGAPSTSLPEIAGTVMVDELSHGAVPHAVSFAIANGATCARIFAAPAQRTDGGKTAVLDVNGEPTNCIPEGARFRLPPPCPAGTPSTPGVCFNVSDLAADPPIVQELAAAAQRYGLVDINSTSGATVYVESGDAQSAPSLVLGSDPYLTAVPGYANTPFFGSSSNQAALALFPWSWLELVQMTVTSSPDATWYTTADPPGPLWPTP